MISQIILEAWVLQRVAINSKSSTIWADIRIPPWTIRLVYEELSRTTKDIRFTNLPIAILWFVNKHLVHVNRWVFLNRKPSAIFRNIIVPSKSISSVNYSLRTESPVERYLSWVLHILFLILFHNILKRGRELNIVLHLTANCILWLVMHYSAYELSLLIQSNLLN